MSERSARLVQHIVAFLDAEDITAKESELTMRAVALAAAGVPELEPDPGRKKKKRLSGRHHCVTCRELFFPTRKAQWHDGGAFGFKCPKCAMKQTAVEDEGHIV